MFDQADRSDPKRDARADRGAHIALVRGAHTVLADPAQQQGAPYLAHSRLGRPHDPSREHRTADVLKVLVGRLVDDLYGIPAGLNYQHR
jgi:hypothetical protein